MSTRAHMMDCRLRLWLGLPILFLSVLAHACSGSDPTAKPTASGPAPSGPPAYEGFVANVSCKGVTAWGWDIQRPNDPIKLDFYEGDVLLDSATADVFGDDLVKAGKGNGKHYIGWPIPVRLQDGKPHIITVKFGGAALEVPLARPGPKEPITCNLEK
jgi:hypothetical protein